MRVAVGGDARADRAALSEASPKDGRPPTGWRRSCVCGACGSGLRLSDPGLEEALYDIESMRRFAGFERGDGVIPDDTTVLNFRRLLETHGLSEKLFAQLRELLESKGLLFKCGTRFDGKRHPEAALTIRA